MTFVERWRRRLRRGRSSLGRSLAQRRVAVQLVAVILGAIFAGVAAVEYSSASGDWQEAIRHQTKHSSAVQEEARAVYGDEAPEGFRIATARARANALRGIGASSRVAASELVVAEQIAFARPRIAPPGTLASGRVYITQDGGYDVARRVADATRPLALLPDADETFADGDRHATTARWISAVTVMFTGLAVAAASVRRRPQPQHRGAPEPEVVPQPGAADPPYRRVTVVLLVLWAAGVLLPFTQLALSGEEQRYQAAAAKTAAQIAGDIATSQARTGFETNALNDAAVAQVAAVAREIAALDASGPDAETERMLAAAEERAGGVNQGLAEQMGRPPTEQEGLDPTVARALASGPHEWGAATQVQAAQADRAEDFGNWSNAAVAAISAVAAVSALVEVGATRTELRGLRRSRPQRD
jgi:hypothetical protein